MSNRTGAPARIWSAETSSTIDAIQYSGYALDQEVVSDTLERLKMPEDAGALQIIGILPGQKPSSHREGEVTFHYLPVLPRYTETDREDFDDGKLLTYNKNAARSLMNMVDYHRSDLGMLYRDEDRLIRRTTRKIGAAGIAGFSLFAANASLASAGAEAANHDWVAAPAVLGSFVVYYYAFEKYRQNVHKREEDILNGEKKDRERMIDYIATGRPLVVPRADAQF